MVSNNCSGVSPLTPALFEPRACARTINFSELGLNLGMVMFIRGQAPLVVWSEHIQDLDTLRFILCLKMFIQL